MKVDWTTDGLETTTVSVLVENLFYIYIYLDRLRSKLDKLYFISSVVTFAGVLHRLPRQFPSTEHAW